MNIGKKIAKLRNDFGITQEQLAEKLQVSRQSVSKWESNESIPKMKRLNEIAKVFNVTLEFFLNEKSKEEITKNVENNDTNISFGIYLILVIISLVLGILRNAFSAGGILFVISSVLTTSYVIYYQVRKKHNLSTVLNILLVISNLMLFPVLLYYNNVEIIYRDFDILPYYRNIFLCIYGFIVLYNLYFFTIPKKYLSKSILISLLTLYFGLSFTSLFQIITKLPSSVNDEIHISIEYFTLYSGIVNGRFMIIGNILIGLGYIPFLVHLLVLFKPNKRIYYLVGLYTSIIAIIFMFLAYGFLAANSMFIIIILIVLIIYDYISIKRKQDFS